MCAINFLDAIASPSSYPPDWVSEWVMFSDFGDSYCIYQAWNLVIRAYRVLILQKRKHVCMLSFWFLWPCRTLTYMGRVTMWKAWGLNCKFISNSNTWAHCPTWAHPSTSVKLFNVYYKLFFAFGAACLCFRVFSQPLASDGCYQWHYSTSPPLVWSSHMGSSQGPGCKLTMPVSSHTIALIPYNLYPFYHCYPCNHSYHIYHLENLRIWDQHGHFCFYSI